MLHSQSKHLPALHAQPATPSQKDIFLVPTSITMTIHCLDSLGSRSRRDSGSLSPCLPHLFLLMKRRKKLLYSVMRNNFSRCNSAKRDSSDWKHWGITASTAICCNAVSHKARSIKISQSLPSILIRDVKSKNLSSSNSLKRTGVGMQELWQPKMQLLIAVPKKPMKKASYRGILLTKS